MKRQEVASSKTAAPCH